MVTVVHTLRVVYVLDGITLFCLADIAGRLIVFRFYRLRLVELVETAESRLDEFVEEIPVQSGQGHLDEAYCMRRYAYYTFLLRFCDVRV